MDLQKNIIQQGIFLFRWRSYIPLLLFIWFFYCMQNFSYFQHKWANIGWETLCFTISFLGLYIRFCVIGNVPAHTSGKNVSQQVAHTLNTRGIYSCVRHPLYVGNFFVGLGISLFTKSFTAVFFYTFSFWVYYEKIMLAEEDFLSKKFGSSFTKWASHTPAFIIRLNKYIPTELPFSFKNILHREHGGFYAIIASFSLLKLYANYVVLNKIFLELEWQIILGCCSFFYTLLYFLNKFTKILVVENR